MYMVASSSTGQIVTRTSSNDEEKLEIVSEGLAIENIERNFRYMTNKRKSVK